MPGTTPHTLNQALLLNEKHLVGESTVNQPIVLNPQPPVGWNVEPPLPVPPFLVWAREG